MTTREELAAAGALGEVSEEEAAEMTALGMSQDEIYAMELAAAAVSLTASEPMPAHLRDRLIGSAQAPTMRPPPPAAVITMKKKVNPWAYVPWIAMAACLLIALVAVIRPWIGGTRSPDKERKDLIASAKDALVVPWTATNDPSGPSASGDVVWSNSAQKGFMRFKGVLPNDPKVTQYQLWIFDADQDEKFPIDGGVFDVTLRGGDAAKNGEVVVPIQAKIAVKKPTMFAVTVEKPGGVVVSKREHIVVLAKP